MLKLLFCKVADVFDRDRQFLFTASVALQENGQALLTFHSEAEIDDMEVEGFVTFYDDVEGLVTYWCSFYGLQRHASEGVMSMTTSAVDMVDQVQRRQDLKTSVRFKIEVDYTDMKGKLRFCQAEVENISAGGVFFTTEHKFALGDSVVLRLAEIAPRLHSKTHILRIQALDDWESSPWLIRSTEVPLVPVKPPAPEGQNIFSFMRKKKKAAAAATEEEQPVAEESVDLEEEEEEEEELVRLPDEEIGGDTVRYGYGCQFRRIGQKNEIAIRRFVFEQERLRLQSTRNTGG